METILSILITFTIALLAGLAVGFVGFRLLRKRFIKKSQEEANSFLQEIKDEVELQELERQEKIQEIEEKAWNHVEKDHLKIEEKIETLQETADEKKQSLENQYSQARQKTLEYEKAVKAREEIAKKQEKKFEEKKLELKSTQKSIVEKLENKLQMKSSEIIKKMVQDLELESRNWYQRWIEESEEDFKTHAESRAKHVIDVAIGRFARPYSSERGIGSVQFPDPNSRTILLDPAGENIKLIQELCGCDLIVDEQSEIIGVAGFDPVRRELTRRTLERLLKEKKPVNKDTINRIADQQKKELFKQIKSDGDQIAKELNLERLHPEVKQMMGSLRYRYSFTQNQYFHCAEVGWLTGLLAAEVRTHIRQARRAGMLHDIGKSMDHAMEGGHASIGANFIAARGEDEATVHAVRAHHYDETPSSDIAFLVIAADAISGARPGARRSTIESYNQKVTVLQDIAFSYEGVTDALVLSGGRELRVYVNSKKIDDPKALDLSRKVAKRIEDECTYPGQIKVVVVRETHAMETTQNFKGHG